jgi:hypothetical protein
MRDVDGARAFGEQAVVADTVEAFWQHVDEEAADELVRGERHAFVSIAARDAGPESRTATSTLPDLVLAVRIGRSLLLHVSSLLRWR